MQVTFGFQATFTTHPGKGEEVVRLLLDSPSLPSEDCVVFLINRSATDPDLVQVTEGWTSQEAHARFFGTEPAQALVAALRPLVAEQRPQVDLVPIGGKAAF
ncbi:quinol monooxygenase YgiN [Crossiella equi]|uniref:Quinol monooxygenase YgiN n=1 Tax=Crossiella equi TaxID=130796 RepID=A0ABS5APY2_9PSEU|nr:antibiotic biosynthesis monooxygenase [Crossiella equi]MBP2478610.1 quinol monooxygenase YgiN [Crossiella equi]